MGHLKEAKLASGSIKPVRVSDYFKHMWLGLKETMFLAYATFAAFVHSFFPFLYGFDMIQWQIDMLKRLNKALPNLEIWKQIKFTDEV